MSTTDRSGAPVGTPDEEAPADRSRSDRVTVLSASRAHRSRLPGRRVTEVAANARPDLVPGVPDPSQGARLVRRVRAQLLAALAVANVVGTTLVITVIAWVLPGRSETELTAQIVWVNAVLAGFFFLLIVPAGVASGEAWQRSGRRWLAEGRAPTDREVIAVLRAPFRLFLVHAAVWLIAAGSFSIANGILDVDLLPRVAFTLTLGGLTTSAFIYLLAERIVRPIATAALSIRDIGDQRLPGVVSRSVLAWTLGTGVPLTGLAIVAIFALAQGDATAYELSITMLVLATAGLLAGWFITLLGARAIADPVASLGKGIERITRGNFDTRIEVYDGSVLGRLQAGFNEMAAGLQERERLRDLYGRQVGEDVAATSLEKGFVAGGELCEVAVLFVDVVGSTAMAHDRPAEEVVDLLNRFFGVVVDEVHGHGGWINKFQGDATLAVFGAPSSVDDAAGQALATARAVSERLPRDVSELAAGIGVAFGSAVAGHIGHEQRFEFTVIGDPVNEAARLTELSKTFEPMVLASAAAVAAAGPEEQAHWEPAGTAELRGRSTPTHLARPVTPHR